MVSLWESWYVKGSFNTRTGNKGEDDIESDKGTRGIVLKQGKTSLGGTCYISWLGRQEQNGLKKCDIQRQKIYINLENILVPFFKGRIPKKTFQGFCR